MARLRFLNQPSQETRDVNHAVPPGTVGLADESHILDIIFVEDVRLPLFLRFAKYARHRTCVLRVFVGSNIKACSPKIPCQKKIFMIP